MTKQTWLVAALSALVLCACAAPPAEPPPNLSPPQLATSASLSSSYQRGESDTISLNVRMDDPDNSLREGVIFLNIVENNPAKNYPQAMHLVFDNSRGTAQPNIFNTVFSGDALRAGLSTQLSFRIRDDAPPDNYLLAIQVFRGNNTNPNRVKISDRLGLDLYHFTIE